MLKKEIKDEVTHILYDQTRRTPIVIPVINEIGVVTRPNGKQQQGGQQGQRPQVNGNGNKSYSCQAHQTANTKASA